MKKIFFLAVILTLSLLCHAQECKYSTFYCQRTTLFKELPVTSSDIIFLGNSITNSAEQVELFKNKHVRNHEISDDICMGVYDRLDAILKGKPVKVSLLTGINDVSRGIPADTIMFRVEMVVRKIKADLSKAKLYLQGVLPVTDHYNMFKEHTPRWQVILEINEGLVGLAEKEGATYIDLYSHFIDRQTGKMNTIHTNDGSHLLGKGYLKWAEIVKPYIGKK